MIGGYKFLDGNQVIDEFLHVSGVFRCREIPKPWESRCWLPSRLSAPDDISAINIATGSDSDMELLMVSLTRSIIGVIVI